MNQIKILKDTYFFLINIIFKGFIYRRPRLKPLLTEKHKASRLEWCINNRNTSFANYVFADETTIPQNYFPRCHLRLRSTNPTCIEGGKKYFYKINLFGVISCRGPCDFYVIF